MTGLPIYQVFGIEAGKIIIAACLKILRHASLIGGLIGVATLAIFYRDPAREVSPLRRIAECALAGALLTAGYLALSYAFLFSLLLLPAPSGG
jgi:hypothetical protein